MPETESSEFSPVCPFCGRRVPRKVAVCRCGTEIGDDQQPLETQTPAQPAPSSISSPVALVIVALAVLTLGAFWLNRPGPAPAPRAAVPVAVPAADQPAESTRPTPAAAVPDVMSDPVPVPNAAGPV